MFNSKKILVDQYIPYYPSKKTCLHDTLLIGEYERILKDLPNYFSNVQIVNFDIIHHECRGDPLKHEIKYYQQILEENFNNIPRENDRYEFISSAIKSRREDIYIEKHVMKKHFVDEDIKKKLRKKKKFLSSLEKKSEQKKYRDSW